MASLTKAINKDLFDSILPTFGNQRVHIPVWDEGQKMFLCEEYESASGNRYYKGVRFCVENPLKVAPLIQSNLTPVKFFHSFILFILIFFVFFLSVMPGSTLNFVYKYNDSFLLLHLRSDSPKSSIRIA